MKIWTWGYFPFTLGGDVNRPVYCEVDKADGPHDVGKGFQAFVVTAPSGKDVVVEATTGAIVGYSLDEVRADIATADLAVMQKQVADSAGYLSRAERVEPEKFWWFLRRTVG